ncbi:membrane MotB of proton-channel complex MotA/MotB family protein [Paraburkholderia xenovorans LB400]|nr:membrane MotB of proton-channel complex MotA/MotB family protein [Paraburkholderia xenovorans LB400]
MSEKNSRAPQGEQALAPVIVRRSKKGEDHGGHHGGAWKIAYADCVTAMMAFFLLMWLLGSTSKYDKQGIEDYFNTPLSSLIGGNEGTAAARPSVVQGGGRDISDTRPATAVCIESNACALSFPSHGSPSFRCIRPVLRQSHWRRSSPSLRGFRSSRKQTSRSIARSRAG